jgi:hypothetical protein
VGVLTVPFIVPEEERGGRAVKGNGGRRRWSLNATVSTFSLTWNSTKRRGTKGAAPGDEAAALEVGDNEVCGLGWARRLRWARCQMGCALGKSKKKRKRKMASGRLAETQAEIKLCRGEKKKLFCNFVSTDLNLNQRFKYRWNTFLNSTKLELSLKNINLRILNQNNFKTQIRNLNWEYFTNRALGASIQIRFQNEFNPNSNFDKSEHFLYAL